VFNGLNSFFEELPMVDLTEQKSADDIPVYNKKAIDVENEEHFE